MKILMETISHSYLMCQIFKALHLGFRDLTFLLCCNDLMTRGSFSCDLSKIYFGWRSARGFQNSTFLCSNNLMSWGSFFVRLGSYLLGLEVCQGIFWGYFYFGIFLCNWDQIYLGWRSARREWALIRSHLSHGKHGIFERHFLVKMKEDIFSVSWGLENALYLKIIVLHLKIPILQCAVIWLSLCYYFNVDYWQVLW